MRERGRAVRREALRPGAARYPDGLCSCWPNAASRSLTTSCNHENSCGVDSGKKRNLEGNVKISAS